MKIMQKQPWDTAIALRDSGLSDEELSDICRIAYLLRDSLHENRWSVKQILHRNGLLSLFCDNMELVASRLNEYLFPVKEFNDEN